MNQPKKLLLFLLSSMSSACQGTLIFLFHPDMLKTPTKTSRTRGEPVGTREEKVENRGTRLLMEQEIIDARQLYALFIVCRMITVTNNDYFLEIIRNMP